VGFQQLRVKSGAVMIQDSDAKSRMWTLLHLILQSAWVRTRDYVDGKGGVFLSDIFRPGGSGNGNVSGSRTFVSPVV
jgi:hypothetical protein